MWGIENPWTTFRYVYQRDFRKKFNFMCLINDKKWNRLSGTERIDELAKRNNRLQISNVKLKDPDNPAKLNGAKLITYSVI